MKDIEIRLARVVAIALALPACTTNDSSDSNCPSDRATVQVSQDVACTIARHGPYTFAETPPHAVFGGDACTSACADAGYHVCVFPDNYALALADGGAVTDVTPPEDDDAGTIVCPSGGPVAIQCAVDCTGRRTAGIVDLAVKGERDVGEYFANSAYLESVSAIAFARLARELEAHGAPKDLVLACRTAEKEEILHAELTTELAREHNATPPIPQAADDTVRSINEIALENAVEGCVRETYGAAIALLRAQRASDRHLRNTLEIIARDECGHAALSWRVAEWTSSRLSHDEREVIARKMSVARQELQSMDDALSNETRAFVGMPPVAEQRRLAMLLETHIFAA